MRLSRRSPREIYRVYSEEEYLGGAGTELGGNIGEWPARMAALAIEGDWPIDRSPVSVDRGGGRRGLRRGGGVAMLAVAAGAVSWVVFLNIAGPHGGGGARGGAVAAFHAAPVVRAAPVADAQPEVAPLRPAVVHAAEAERPQVPPLGRSPANARSRRPAPRPPHAHRSTHPSVRRRIDVAVPADYVPRRSPGAVSDAPADTGASTEPASIDTAPAASSAEKRPEFGFER
ncbi:MAG: hypothetical protein ACRDK7_16180 [Solirubrobacteraceae bacterium]